MATDRERELLAWIAENPMVSQQELAERAGITRSSVAVHISNLMKKGYIQGKGYVLRKSVYAAVVGGANIDILGYAGKHLTAGDSNPGRVEISMGGVARNQAHNLRLLGVDVKLVAAFGEDSCGDELRLSCRELGIDIASAVTVPHGCTSTYVSIVDENGNLQAGVSDMRIYEQLRAEVLAPRMSMLNNAALCAADTNLPAEVLRYLAENCTVPLFVETISAAKIVRAAPVLARIHTLRADEPDIGLLLGQVGVDVPDARKAALQLLEKGVKNVFLHRSAGSVLCANAEQMIELPYLSERVANKNGARDSFMAALLWAHMKNLSFEAAARAGVAAASLCAASNLTVNGRLSEAYLLDAPGKPAT